MSTNNHLSISQKSGIQIRKYELMEDKVKAEIKTDSFHQTYFIPYDEIEFEEIIMVQNPNRTKIVLFFSVFLNFLLFFIAFEGWLKKFQLGSLLPVVCFLHNDVRRTSPEFVAVLKNLLIFTNPFNVLAEIFLLFLRK